MENNYISSVSFKSNSHLDKESYLNTLPVLRYLKKGNLLEFNRNVTFFVGENGAGKSTLLEAIAVNSGFNPEGGSKNFCFSTRETEYALADCLTISKKAYPKDHFFLRAESFYNVASNIEELEVSGYGEASLHEQSHGESFLALFLNRFRGEGLYLLDEPEAALSPLRQMTFLARMHDLVQEDSQFIISTHSPILLAYPDADIFELSDSGIKKVKYEETEVYLLYKEFLNAPERMLKHLL